MAKDKGTLMHIAHAAIRRADGITATGRSHSEIINSSPKGTCKNIPRGNQGFVTNTGRFVERLAAFWIAFEAGQLSEEFVENVNPAYLLSEYLWSDNNFKYDPEKGYYK